MYNRCGARGKDKDRSDAEEDVVVDAADTLSDKGGRGDKTTTTIMGARREIWTMDVVVGVAAVLNVSKGEDGGSLILVVLEGRTTIGLTMRKTWW